MRKVGLWLIVLGVLSFALSSLGYDLIWFDYRGMRCPAGVSPVALGIVLIGLAPRRKQAP